MSTIQTKAQLRYLRMGPRKLRPLLRLVQGEKVSDALVQLQFSSANAAKPILKLLKSAIANAKNNHNAVMESLVIQSAVVDSGPTIGRWMPKAFGRATPIRKRTAHVTLVLSGESAGKVEEKPKKETKEKEEVQKTEEKEVKEKATKKKTTKKVTKKKATSNK